MINKGELIGYARVSTTGQKLDVQISQLKEFGCSDDHIFMDKLSGTTAQRPKLQECLKFVRRGDTLVITKMDRLARSTLHLHQIVSDLNDRGVGFKVLDQSIDTTTNEGRLLFTMLAAIAEFETSLRKDRQMSGIENAKMNNVKFGAKAKLTPEQVNEMRRKRADRVLIKDLMKEFKISKASVYRLLKDDGEPAMPTPDVIEFSDNEHLLSSDPDPLNIADGDNKQCQISNNTKSRSRCRIKKDTQLVKIQVGQRGMICYACPKHIKEAEAGGVIRPHQDSHSVFGGE